MTVREISYPELEKAIRISFEGDTEILKMYDQRVSVNSVEDIVADIVKKVESYDKAQIKGVFDKNQLVGYFVRGAGMLISFALCMRYRVRKRKREFFALIREDFKGMFICFLWSSNIRGIRFLEKSGMKAVSYNEKITKLIFKNE